MESRINGLYIILAIGLFSTWTWGKEVNLKWQKMSFASSYDLQVSSDESFQNVVIEEEVKSNSVTKNLDAGTYFLRVKGVRFNGDKSPWSTPLKLEVTQGLDPVGMNFEEEIEWRSPDQEILLQWTALSKATGYGIKVIRDGKGIKEEEVSTTSYTYRIPSPGLYRFRVKGKFGNRFGPSEVIKIAQVVKAKDFSQKVAAPVVIAPTLVSSEAKSPSKNVEPGKNESRFFAEKSWSLGIGTFWGVAIGAGTGSKMVANIARNFGVAERLDWDVFYNALFNTASYGTTYFAHFGIGTKLYWDDRLADKTPFIRADLGYGGSNRTYEAAFIGGLGIGYQFYRTHASSFEFVYRKQILWSSATGREANYPTVDEIKLVVLF